MPVGTQDLSIKQGKHHKDPTQATRRHQQKAALPRIGDLLRLEINLNKYPDVLPNPICKANLDQAWLVVGFTDRYIKLVPQTPKVGELEQTKVQKFHKPCSLSDFFWTFWV